MYSMCIYYSGTWIHRSDVKMILTSHDELLCHVYKNHMAEQSSNITAVDSLGVPSRLCF